MHSVVVMLMLRAKIGYFAGSPSQKYLLSGTKTQNDNYNDEHNLLHSKETVRRNTKL